MSTVAQKLVTAEEFFQMPEPADGSRTELVRGERLQISDCRLQIFGNAYSICNLQSAIYNLEEKPDLAVEVLSPSNRLSKIREKMQEYFQRGVRMVWVVDPEDRTVAVYRSMDEGRILHESATLDGGDVLPGFSCRITEIFA